MLCVEEGAADSCAGSGRRQGRRSGVPAEVSHNDKEYDGRSVYPHCHIHTRNVLKC